ncbi:hypothetical protein ABFA07_004399 [Porites harrisoni]
MLFNLYHLSDSSPETLSQGQVGVLPKKKGRKICKSCNQLNPSASKRCKVEGCGAKFPEKSVDWEKIHSMGQTNPTRQRELLEKRLNKNILNPWRTWPSTDTEWENDAIRPRPHYLVSLLQMQWQESRRN